MNYRTLGRTGLRCSEIGLGTWALASRVYGDVTSETAAKTIGTALDNGITFFDSAPLYGDDDHDGIAEERLGLALGTRRDEAVISTKFGRNSREEGKANFHAKRARSSVEESLTRMGTDRIEVLFFHSPFSPDDIHDDVWEELGRLKDEGKVLHVAHSISLFEDTQQMARDWAAERKIDVIQVVYSLMNREAESLIHDLAEQGIGIVARESLANGFLSGRITKDTVFPEGSLNAQYSREDIAERVDQAERLRFLVRDDVTSLPQAALRWVLDNPATSLVLSGAIQPDEIEECAAASDAAPFHEDEMRTAKELHQKDFPAA